MRKRAASPDGELAAESVAGVCAVAPASQDAHTSGRDQRAPSCAGEMRGGLVIAEPRSSGEARQRTTRQAGRDQRAFRRYCDAPAGRTGYTPSCCDSRSPPPSPTGYLHAGGAHRAVQLAPRRRRAACSYSASRTPTPSVRRDEMVDGILQGMRWLGVNWDKGPEVGGTHGPYFQISSASIGTAPPPNGWSAGHAYCSTSPRPRSTTRRARPPRRGARCGATSRRSKWALPEVQARELPASTARRARSA